MAEFSILPKTNGVVRLVKQSAPLKELATRATHGDFTWFDGMLPNPDSVLRSSGQSLSVYRELLKDPHIGGAVARRKAGTKRLRWYVNREGADKTAADVIEEVFNQLPVRKIVGEILDAPLFGYQPLEILWEERDVDGVTYWLPRNVLAKPREWFNFRTSDNALMFKPRSGEAIEVPMDRFLLAQYEASYDNPYGDALLSRCFWPNYIKKNGIEFWSVFAEKYGMPWFFVYYPDGLDPSRAEDQETINSYVAAADRMVQDAVGALPQGAKGEFQSGASTASMEIYKGLCEYLDDQCTKAILGHTGSIDSVPGSLGGQDQAGEATSDVLGDDESLVSEQLNRLKDLVCDMNFPGSVVRPVIEAYKKEDIDKAKAERDEVLTRQGVKFTRAYFLDTYGFVEEDLDAPAPPIVGEVAADSDNELRGSVGGSVQIGALQDMYYSKKIPRDAAIANVVVIFGLSQAEAESLFIEEVPDAPTLEGTEGTTGTRTSGSSEEAGAALFSEGDIIAPDQAAVDEVAGTLTPEQQQFQMEQMLKPVFAAMAGATDYTEAMEQLLEMFPKMNTADVQAIMARVNFMTDLVGRLSVDAQES